MSHYNPLRQFRLRGFECGLYGGLHASNRRALTVYVQMAQEFRSQICVFTPCPSYGRRLSSRLGSPKHLSKPNGTSENSRRGPGHRVYAYLELYLM